MPKKVLLLVLIVIVLVCAAGYAASSKIPQNINLVPGHKPITLSLYYSDIDLMKVVTEKRTVNAAEGTNPVIVALEELKKTPKNSEAVVLMPAGTEVIDIKVSGGVLYLNFNEKLIENFIGGSAAEAMLITSIVNTVTDIEGYEKLQVQFLVNGEIVDSIGGHIGAEDPFTRYDRS